MADTTFIDQQTVISAQWANDVNDLVYDIFQGASTANEAVAVLPAATEIRKGLLTAEDKIKLDNFTVIEVANESTNIVLELNDNYNYIKINSPSPATVTVPNNSQEAFSIGSFIFVEQSGAGEITFVPDTGVTINTSKTLVTGGPSAVASLIKVNTNEWTLTGNLAL